MAVDLRHPAQEILGSGYVGTAHAWIILGQLLIHNRTVAAGQLDDLRPDSGVVTSDGLPRLTGSWKSAK